MQETQQAQVNFLRQYYDVYQLLQLQKVQAFLGTAEYETHKQHRFPNVDLETPLKDNQALRLENEEIRRHLKSLYHNSRGLYYAGQPDFDEMIRYIGTFLNRL